MHFYYTAYFSFFVFFYFRWMLVVVWVAVQDLFPRNGEPAEQVATIGLFLFEKRFWFYFPSWFCSQEFSYFCYIVPSPYEKFSFFIFSIIFSGISLSPFQIGKAKEFTESQGLSSKMEYQVADAMKMPFKENSFDLSKYKYYHYLFIFHDAI